MSSGFPGVLPAPAEEGHDEQRRPEDEVGEGEDVQDPDSGQPSPLDLSSCTSRQTLLARFRISGIRHLLDQKLLLILLIVRYNPPPHELLTIEMLV